MILDPTKNNWIDVPNLTGGWNTFDEASNIKDNETPFTANTVYDGGVISPRPGSTLLYAMPDGETGVKNQLVVPRTSDGLEYLVAIYGVNFYLRHEVNNEWILINQVNTNIDFFQPIEDDLYYGTVNWNNGRGDDRTYFCNGVDPVARWDVCVSTVNGALSSGGAYVTLTDGTRFPASGDLLLKGASGLFTEAYTAKPNKTATTISFDSATKQIRDSGSGLVSAGFQAGQTLIVTGSANNDGSYTVVTVASGAITVNETIVTEIAGATVILTSPHLFKLSNTLDQNVANGASATVPMYEKGDMKRGKIMAKHQLRLFIANYYGGETTVNYSIKNDPEDFSTGTGISQGSTIVLADGNGQITGAHDFGDYIVIEKEESLHHIQITISNDLTTKLDVVTPILSGQSLGPVDQTSTVKVLSALFYLTKTEGFLLIYPQARLYSQAATSGNNPIGQTGINFDNLVSRAINKYLMNNASFDKCRSVFFDQKLLFAAAIKGGTQNTLVFTYDNERNIWGLIKGWAVQDFARKDDILLYMDNGSGAIYQAFAESYDDNNNPYQVDFFTKEFNFGAPSRPKTGSFIYIEGLMTPATDLFVDVLYNKGGQLKVMTFQLNKDTQGLSFSQPLTSALGQPIQGVPILSAVPFSQIGNASAFHGYLGISNRHGYYAIQCRIYSNKAAFWAVSTLGFHANLEAAIPSEMVISPLTTS